MWKATSQLFFFPELQVKRNIRSTLNIQILKISWRPQLAHEQNVDFSHCGFEICLLLQAAHTCTVSNIHHNRMPTHICCLISALLHTTRQHNVSYIHNKSVLQVEGTCCFMLSLIMVWCWLHCLCSHPEKSAVKHENACTWGSGMLSRPLNVRE